MGVLSLLPNWKKNATAYERLSELALMARDKPEKFEEFVIVYRETRPNGYWKIHTVEYKGDLTSRLGLLDLGKDRIMKDSEV